MQTFFLKRRLRRFRSFLPTMLASNKYKLKVYQGLEGLAAIQKHWRNLMQQLDCKGFWHYYEWYESYLQYLEPEPERLFFFVLFDSEQVLAILPLKHQSKRFKGVPLNVLELPRHSHIKLKDIVFPRSFQTDAALEALLNGLKQLTSPPWDVILLHDLLPNACALTAFAKMPVTKIIEHHDACDAIDIGSSSDSINEGMSKQLKKSLKVSNRRAAAMGTLTSAAVRHPDHLRAAFQAFLDLEASGWKGPQGTRTAIRCDPKVMGFYASLVQKFGALNQCEVALLYLNEQTIAGTFSLIVDDTAYSLKIAYDESKANLSPGNLQREKLMLNYAQQQSIRSLNLVSGSSSPWHRRWNITSRTTYRLYLFNRSAKAYMAFTMKNAKKKIKAALKNRNLNARSISGKGRL